MTAEDFLNDINEKTWKNNIGNEVERHFSKILEFIEENKDIILEEVTKDINRIESIKNEDKELFTYNDSQKWIEYYIKECLKALL